MSTLNKQKFHLIYKITNLIDGQYYIRKHQTYRVDDSYMGSGALLLEEIKKLGKHNFKKEIICICHDEEHLNTTEKELVILRTVDPKSYNLIPGGGAYPIFTPETVAKISKTSSERAKGEGNSPYQNKAISS